MHVSRKEIVTARFSLALSEITEPLRQRDTRVATLLENVGNLIILNSLLDNIGNVVALQSSSKTNLLVY